MKTSPVVVQMHNFTEQFESGTFSDCRVQCGDRVWNLHKLILSSRCQFFAGMLRNDCKESSTSEIALEEQDPKVVDWALRYIYSCNLSHLDGIEANDPHGMELKGYDAYIPLYILADFLGLPALCRDLIGRLHRINRRIAAHLQRWAILSDFTGLPKTFVDKFSKSAELAYSIPAPRTEDDTTHSRPGGLRNIFVEFFEFCRYSCIDAVLPRLAATVPQLLVEIIVTMRLTDGAGIESSAKSTCKDCGMDPVRGTGESWPDANTGGTARMSAGRDGNFWARKDLCFECSVFYPREKLIYLGPQDSDEEGGEDGDEDGGPVAIVGGYNPPG
ncbi:hypothetical protein OQA88_11549 [Cercophora sp. LCS_1]